MYGNYGYGYHMNGLGFFGGILEFVFWIFVIILVIRILRHIFGGRKYGHGCWGGMCGHEMHGDKSISILRERYAKGEIEKKEFDEKKKELEA